jgi:hypothetical protein
MGLEGGSRAAKPREASRKLQVPSGKRQVSSPKGGSSKSQVSSYKPQGTAGVFVVGRAAWEGRSAPRRKKAAWGKLQVSSSKSQVPSRKGEVASHKLQVASEKPQGMVGVFLVRGGLGGRGASRRDSLFLRGSVAPQSGPPTKAPSHKLQVSSLKLQAAAMVGVFLVGGGLGGKVCVGGALRAATSSAC